MLGIIGNKFSIGKETYQPYSAELHYFRVNKRYWSICFERIKRAGFHIISTAVPWNIHQDAQKHFDFSGFSTPEKDLIVFLELAREFGFKVILRPGPWVAGQLPNGGLPDFLFNDIRTLARDSQGEEISLPDSFGVKGGYLPSYLSSNFQFHLRSYFKAFIEITKNYVHPRGPIFMVELDYETSFGRLLDPGSADYNKDVLAQYYPGFLQEKYGDIKQLNKAYKEKNNNFERVEPPRRFKSLAIEKYPKVMDWFRFREFMLGRYLEELENVFTTYTVEPLFFRSLYFKSGEMLPAYNLVPSDRAPFLGANVFPEGTYFDLVNKARFLKAEYGFAFASSFTSGNAAADPEREQEMAPVSVNQQRFYYAAGLSAGFKGLNHYMFVDRDHWYGAPLKNDGTVSPSYDTARNFNQAIAAIGFEDMETKTEVAIIASRLNYWIKQTSSAKEFSYAPRLVDDSTTGFARDLMRLKMQYAIRENREWDSLDQYKLIFVTSTEVMPQRDQEALIELAKNGTTIIMCGVMPRYDENFKDCQVLAKALRIKTTVDYQIGSITHKEGEFPSYTYGSIRSTDEGKVKKLAQVGTKIVAVCSNRFKGHFYLFAFDIASAGDHHKLNFIEAILKQEGLESHLYCSDVSVDIAFHVGPRKGLLFVVVPPPGELSDGLESGRKEIIIKGDLKELGFNSATIKLTNILDGEEAKPIKVTAKEFKEGIAIDVNYPDGLVFAVTKR